MPWPSALALTIFFRFSLPPTCFAAFALRQASTTTERPISTTTAKVSPAFPLYILLRSSTVLTNRSRWVSSLPLLALCAAATSSHDQIERDGCLDDARRRLELFRPSRSNFFSQADLRLSVRSLDGISTPDGGKRMEAFEGMTPHDGNSRNTNFDVASRSTLSIGPLNASHRPPPNPETNVARGIYARHGLNFETDPN